MGSRKGTLPGGLLIPERCRYTTLAANTAAATTSDYGEANPRPGFPIASDQWSQLRVEISGEQAEDCTLYATKGGQPARDGVQLAIKPDSATRYYTWDSPALCTNFIPLDWGNADTEVHDIATIPSSQKVVIARQDGTDIKLTVIDTDHSVTDQAATIGQGDDWNYPAIVVAPGSERILCFYGGASYYSDDEGATWSTLSSSISSETTTNYGPTSAAVYRDTIVLLVEDTSTAETIHHLVSTDGGASFQLVQSTASLGIRVDCVANEDGLHIVWVDENAAVEYRRLGQPFEPLDAVSQTVLGTGSQYEECTIWADGAGSLYVIAGAHGGFLFVSHSSGDDWSTNYKSRAWYLEDTANDKPSKYRATYALGQAFVVTGFYNGSSYATTRPGVIVLGGWADMQVIGQGTRDRNQLPRNGWGFGPRDGSASVQGGTYFPWDVPGNQGWTAAGAGTETSSTTNGALNISTSSNGRSWSQSLGNDVEVILARAHLRQVSGGSASTQDIAITARIADASSYEYECEVLITSSSIVLNDVNGSGTATLSVDATAYGHVIVWISKADEVAYIAHRTPGALTWEVSSGVSLTDAGATANSSRIQWGHIASSTAESDWREFHWVESGTTAAFPDIATAIASRYSRSFNSRPEPLPGLSTSIGPAWLSAVAGPARKAETVDIDAHHDHSIEHVHAELHPGLGTTWRSDDLTAQIGSYDLGANGWVGHAVALFVSGANFKTIYLESYNGSSWDTEAQLQLDQGFKALRYTLSGEMLYPDTSTTNDAGRWLWEQEKRNAFIQCYDGTNTYATRIVSQSSGGWTQSTTAIPMLQLEDVTDISTLSGTLRCNIGSPSGLILKHQTSVKARRYWRWRIPAGTAGEDTPRGESYYEAAVISICRVQAFGAEVGWGNRDEVASNSRFDEDESGTERGRSLGVERRTWTLGGWASGPTHLGNLRTGPDADYVGSSESNALGLAGYEDVYHQIRGLLRVTDGGTLPVVAVEPLPDTSEQSLTDPTRFLYGYLSGSVGASRLTGDHGATTGAGEVLRVDDIVIREIV